MPLEKNPTARLSDGRGKRKEKEMKCKCECGNDGGAIGVCVECLARMGEDHEFLSNPFLAAHASSDCDIMPVPFPTAR